MREIKKSKKLLNRILRAFGLMKIKTAKRFSTILHVHYVQSVLTGVKKDFNVNPVKDALLDARGWIGKEFIKMVNTGEDDLNIITPPYFKEDK